MFKTIVVAVDGSKASSRAFAVALGFAKDQNARLHAVHVIDDSSVSRDFLPAVHVPAEYFEAVLNDLRTSHGRVLAALQKLAQKANCPLIATLLETKAESVSSAVLRYTKKVHADLLVLGTHGRRGLRRLVMGSDAEMILREASLPVLMVRAAAVSRRRPQPKSSAVLGPRSKTTPDALRGITAI